MQIVLATSNRGKIKEFNKIFKDRGVIAYKDILGDIEIIEDGKSFKENALIKAKTIYRNLNDFNYIVISDDSGISVPILDNEPNIYSARYAKEGATDKENLNKLISKLKEKGVTKTSAYYTASIAIVSKDIEYTIHGWMHGDVITTQKGDKGFGYDPIFIPEGFNRTLGELDSSIKTKISHRAKALNLAKPIIKLLDTLI